VCKLKLFKLTKNEDTNKNEIKNIKIYESDNYKLRIFEYESGYINIDTGNKHINEYTPNIYLKENDNFKIEKLEIETCGCGSLDCENIKLMIEQYEMAIESVKEIEEILNENGLLKK
jgi:hypothetical protein